MSWQQVPLRRVFRLVNGGTPTSDAVNWNGEVPWATPVDIGNVNGVYLSTTQRSLSDEGVRTGSRAVPTGSLVLSIRAPIGYVAQVTEPMAFNQGCRGLVPTTVIEPRYFRYQLLALREELSSRGAGSTFMELSTDALATVPVMHPPLDEQRRIADFLDAETAFIDHLVNCSKVQQQLLDEKFAELLRIGTTGVEGPSISTGVGWMPAINAEWKLRKISREFRTSSGTTPNSEMDGYFGGTYPWVNSSDLSDGSIERIERSVTKAALDAYPALRIQPAGSLVIAMYGQGETKGRTGVLLSEACLNQACCALIPIGRVVADFAACWFRAHRAGVISLAYGAGQPNLSQELIRQLMIPAPEVSVQEQIVAELAIEEAQYRLQYSLLARRCNLLDERRQALITGAVTGQIDVTTARGVAV